MIDAYFKKLNSPGPVQHKKLVFRLMEYRQKNALLLQHLLHKFRAGNNRVILVDFELDQIVERGVRIYALRIRRLIDSNQRFVVSCNKRCGSSCNSTTSCNVLNL